MDPMENALAASPIVNRDPPAVTSEDNHEHELLRLEEEACVFHSSHKTTKSRDDLENAIATMRKVVAMLPGGRTRRAVGLLNLAAFLYDLYGLDDSVEVLNEAIELAEEASHILLKKKPTDATKMRCLEILTHMHYERYFRYDDLEDLKESVETAKMITGAAPATSPNRAYCFNHLGVVSHELFKHTNDEEDLQQAIGALEEAVRVAMLDDQGAHEVYVENLKAAWISERDLKGGTEGLETTIEAARKAVETAENPTSRARNLFTLGTKLLEKAEVTESLPDLEDAIETLKETLDAGLEDEQSQISLLISLASATSFKHEMTGLLSDIEDAIKFSTEAFERMHPGHEEVTELCARLLEYLGRRHHTTGSRVDLERALKMGTRGLEMTSEEHSGRGRLLHSIGQRFIDLFRTSGNLQNLEQGLDYVRQAAKFIANRAGYDWMLAARDLAMGLLDYYNITMALGSLDEAIDVFTEILRMAEGTPFDNMLFLSDLAMAYRLKHQRTNDATYIEKAVNVMMIAIDQADDDPNHAYYLELASQSLKDRYWHSRNLLDLDKSIDLGRKSIEMTPQDNVQRAFRLCEVAESLRERHMATQSLEDLNEAILFAGDGLSLLGDDHVYRAEGLYILATSLRFRYKTTNKRDDEKEMQKAFRLALDHTQSLALIRLQAGSSVVYEHVQRLQWEEAYEASKTIVNLMPSLILRSVENADKQEALKKAGGLASDSAALALQMGETPSTALDLLEKGRGIIATSLEDLGVDLTSLEAHHPELAERFSNLREEVRRYGDQRKDDNSSWGDTRNRRRREAETELEEVLNDIRLKDGFENFMLAPSESEMRQAAREGPIVVINSSTFRCDAIIVQAHQITSLPLPHFKEADLTRHLNERTLDTLGALEWLWDCIAEPVLSALGFVDAPPEDSMWPHIWWIMPGLLGKLPIHAAGYHKDRSSKAVFDRVVSSYHNSVRSMVRSCRRTPLGDAQAGQALLVAMNKTPGASDLPFAQTEISIIKKPFKELSVQPIELSPSKGKILAELPQCSIFHFAGHSFRSSHNPLDSYLALDRGPENSITVNNLLEISLYKSPPLLAYLSACGTGQMHNYQLADESLHLISGFLLAGFRHVIGTLWEVQDAVCVDMARLTYEGMKERGLSDVSVAWALHNASRTLRDRWLESSDMASFLLERDMRSMKLESGQNQEHGERFQRDLVSVDDDERERLHWAPYVHFGS